MVVCMYVGQGPILLGETYGRCLFICYVWWDPFIWLLGEACYGMWYLRELIKLSWNNSIIFTRDFVLSILYFTLMLLRLHFIYSGLLLMEWKWMDLSYLKMKILLCILGRYKSIWDKNLENMVASQNSWNAEIAQISLRDRRPISLSIYVLNFF